MKVGIIGSGGREHALCEALSKSKKINFFMTEYLMVCLMTKEYLKTLQKFIFHIKILLN